MDEIKKADILRENLCIKRIISVVKGKNPHSHKLLKVNGRHSDAFVYVLSGDCTYRFYDKTGFRVTAGDFIYLPKGSVYTMYITTEAYSFIFCDFEFLEETQKKSLLLSNAEQKGIDSGFLKLFNRYRSPSGNTYTECMSVLYSIYGAIQQNYGQEGYLGKSKRDEITKARLYIDENFASADLSISALSEDCGMSEVYFRRLFKARYGQSPSKYLLSVRLKSAKRLMQYPFLTLRECAEQSGFSSLQYFCRVFKNETGESPGKYKRGL